MCICIYKIWFDRDKEMGTIEKLTTSWWTECKWKVSKMTSRFLAWGIRWWWDVLRGRWGRKKVWWESFEYCPYTGVFSGFIWVVDASVRIALTVCVTPHCDMFIACVLRERSWWRFTVIDAHDDFSESSEKVKSCSICNIS